MNFQFIYAKWKNRFLRFVCSIIGHKWERVERSPFNHMEPDYSQCPRCGFFRAESDTISFGPEEVPIELKEGDSIKLDVRGRIVNVTIIPKDK